MLLFAFQLCFAQKEASHWYFGINAGLDFSSGTPVPDTNGSLITLEGCATISDAFGGLLFYTDGTTVWNRNHDIMPHGKSLAGDPSSTQSAIIVPNPSNSNTYYIFTADWFDGQNGLNYYTVDMSLEGGSGDLIGSNNIPTKTNLIISTKNSPTSEKITAVKVLNENSFWVLALKQDRFYVYKVTSSGVNQTPIIGNTGFSSSTDLRGYLKTSPDGTLLVSANMSSGTFLYDFDSSTGIVSNERQLDLLGLYGYGAEFSPLSTKLYLSTGDISEEDNGSEENLFQFNLDILDPTGENLNFTRVNLHTYINRRAALQLGLDGKIYRAIDNESFLGVINFPEEIGIEANYDHKEINLGGRKSSEGLPPFIQSFFAANIQFENQCFGDETQFLLNSNIPVTDIVWDFGDGSIPSTELNPKHTYTTSGFFDVRVVVSTDRDVQIINQSISIFDTSNLTSPVDLVQCDDDTDGETVFNLTEAAELISNEISEHFFSYHSTLADAQDNLRPILNTNNFLSTTGSRVFVRVEPDEDCYSTAEINLKVSATSIPTDFMVNVEECDDDSNGIATFNLSEVDQKFLDLFKFNQDLVVSYYEKMEDALSEQNEIYSQSYRNESSPYSQQIFVRIDNEITNACFGLGAHINLTINILPEFELIEDQILCLNQLPNPLIIGVENEQGDYMYEWRNSNGELLESNGTSILEVKEAGEYFVTAITNKNCRKEKRISIKASNIASIINVEIIDISNNNAITIHVSGEGDYEFALDDINGQYQELNYFDGLIGGTYIVYVRDKNNCGIQTKSITLLNIPKFFTPNEDGVNDTWQIDGIFTQPNSKIYIYDKFGKLLKQIESLGSGWNGYYNGNPLPSSDYWYLAHLEDGRVYKGHFSLIRN